MAEPEKNYRSTEYITLKEYIDIRVRALEQSVSAALHANETQVKAAADAVNFRLESMNEFRSSLEDQTRSYVRESSLDALRERIL